MEKEIEGRIKSEEERDERQKEGKTVEEKKREKLSK